MWSFCFTQSCGVHEINPDWPSQPDSLGAIPSDATHPCPPDSPGWRATCGAQNSHTVWLTVFQFVGHPSSGYGIWFYCAPFFILLWLLLCFWVENISSDRFQSFLLTQFSKQLVLILVVLWEEVSSSPSTLPSSLQLPLILHILISSMYLFHNK